MPPPLLDEHAVDIDAPPAAVWAALLDRCATSLDRAPVHVTEATPGSRLRLEGRHRFAAYELTFRLGGATTLTAESRADFPGLAGAVYRAMLLGTGVHVLAVKRMLADVPRRVA